MSITAQCPDCSAPIKAPDSAAGKRAKCPKCGSVVVLPPLEAEVVEDDFEVVEDEPTPKKKKPRPRDDEDDRPRRRVAARAADDEDDDRPRKKSRRRDDDDDDDDQPQRSRKSRGRKAAKPSYLPFILAGGGVALLIGIGVFVWQMTKASDAGNPAKTVASASGAGPVAPPKPALPDGWIMFNDPDGRFSAAMPAQPKDAPNVIISPTASRVKMWQVAAPDRTIYQVVIQTIPSGPPGDPPPFFMKQFSDQFIASTNGQMGRVTSRGTTNVAGITANELLFESPQGYAKMVLLYSKHQFYLLTVAGTSNPTASDANANAFFDNFRLK